MHSSFSNTFRKTQSHRKYDGLLPSGRFGSQAEVHNSTTRSAAFERIADVQCDQKRRYLRVLFFEFDENNFKRFVAQILW